MSQPGIAQRLVLAEHAVHRHLASIFRRLNLSSRGGRGLRLRAGLV
jgi:DNA-binding NarL/FixJ family response regulator